MPSVDTTYGSYLKSAARFAAYVVPGAATKWPGLTASSSTTTALVETAAGQAEAQAQAAFLAGPLARDTIVILDLRSDLVGSVVTIIGDRLGYEAGADVFVIGAAENENIRATTLTVLKRL